MVSTTGVIAGVAAGSGNQKVVMLAGFVTLAVEALSMAAGEFLSEQAVHELDARHRGAPVVGGAIMLTAYFAAGLLPLLPVIFLPLPESIYVSIALALAGLFALGVVKARVVQTAVLRSGLEVLAVGGIAALIGVAAGVLLKV